MWFLPILPRKSVVAPWVLHYLKLYEQVIDIVWSFNTGQDNRNSLLGLSKGWPQLFNRGDYLIEVKITLIKGNNFLDFDNCLRNRAWEGDRLIQGRLKQVWL